VILVGGTFDPPHLAHTELADAARQRIAPEAALVFVPAARSPHKAEAPAVEDAHRLAMLRLAIADLDRASIWTDELDRAEAGRPSYWVTTLERARAILGPRRGLMFLIGADQATSFHRWREPGRILELADPIVINRGEIQTREELARRLAGTAFGDLLVRAWIQVPEMNISATAIRRALASYSGADVANGLPVGVASYIQEHGLYRG